MNLYKRGSLKLGELISQHLQLEQVNTAFDALREGTLARSVVEL